MLICCSSEQYPSNSLCVPLLKLETLFLQKRSCLLVFFFLKFIFMVVWSLFLCTGFLWLWRRGLLSSCSAQASHCGGFSCCRAQPLGAWAAVVGMHESSSSAACGIFLDQGSHHVPCTGRWIHIHCTTTRRSQFYYYKHIQCYRRMINSDKFMAR